MATRSAIKNLTDMADAGAPSTGVVFPGLAPIAQMPAHLKKAAAAVHMYPLSGSYSHFTRRVFNALLALALREWNSLSVDQQVEVYDKRIVPRFRTTMAQLRVVLNLSEDDRGYDRLYEAIDCLYRLEFKFDVMEDLGQEWTVSSRLISQWARPKMGSGEVEWEYPPDVLQMLLRPMPFALINMRLANSLSSKYALALYENTCRYINNPGKLTRRLPVEQWIQLIAGARNSYCQKEYKYFKRYVINPSLAELESSEHCSLRLTLIETKVARSKVTHLQFKVELKHQLPLPTEMGRGPDPRLAEGIRSLGINEKKLNELLVSMEEGDLQRVYDATLERVRKGGVANKAGYFLKMCELELTDEEVAEDAASLAESAPAPLLLDAVAVQRADASRRQAKRLREVFEALPEDQRKLLVAQFAQSPAITPSAREKLAAGLGVAKGVERVFFGWLANNGGAELLRNAEESGLTK